MPDPTGSRNPGIDGPLGTGGTIVPGTVQPGSSINRRATETADVTLKEVQRIRKALEVAEQDIRRLQHEISQRGESSNLKPIVVGTVVHKEWTETQLTANTNNWALPIADTSFIRIDSDKAVDISGIVAPIANCGGLRLTLRNFGAFTMTFLNNSGASAAGNRIITGTGANFALAAGVARDFVYDQTSAEWVLVNN